MQLQARIREDVALIPTDMVKAAFLSTKRRAIKLVECQGEAFTGRRVMQGSGCKTKYTIMLL